MWPITRFLYELTGAVERAELARILVERLAADSRHQAFREVETLIDDGLFDDALAVRLQRAFPERLAGLREALAATDSQHAARDESVVGDRVGRQRFRPHLWVASQRDRSTQLAMLAVTGGIERWAKIPLPDAIATEDWREQQRLVYRAVRAHHASGDAHVAIPFAGAVVGYWYRPRLESRYWVAIDGIVHNWDHGPFEEPRGRRDAELASLVG